MAVSSKQHGQKNWTDEMITIRLAVGLSRVQIEKNVTGHAWDRGVERLITVRDICHGLKHPKARIVGGEPPGARRDPWGNRYKLPTRIIRTFDQENQPFYVVVAISLPDRVVVVTVYGEKPALRSNR